MFDALACMDSGWVKKPQYLRSIDVYVVVEMLFMRFDAQVVICAGDRIWLPINPHQVMGMKNYTCKYRKLDSAKRFE